MSIYIIKQRKYVCSLVGSGMEASLNALSCKNKKAFESKSQSVKHKNALLHEGQGLLIDIPNYLPE